MAHEGVEEPPGSSAPGRRGAELPMAGRPGAPTGPARSPERPVLHAERGVVLFDLDGTLLDDLELISEVAADVMHKTFGTPAEEARIHYLATTGMPFEAQLAQLYPEAPAALRSSASRTFHQRKVTEAYARAEPFSEVPRLLKALATARWSLAVTTGAETEMAELLLEREGLRYWFDDVVGSAEGTKREHLAEYRRRYGGALMFLVGDSRFDLEAALSVPGVTPLARASTLPGWTLSPHDLKSWGAVWAGFSLAELPVVLERLARSSPKPRPRRRPRARAP